MKKILATLLALVMIASICAIGVSAEGEWAAFGEVSADFDKNFSTKITLDGDTSDWAANGYRAYELDQFNFDPWLGEVGEDWHITMYFSSDADFLYVAFKIYDPTVTPSNFNGYGGDAFQIQLDFNGACAAAEAFERAVFYSFGYQEDGEIDITVQCIYGDAASTTDYNMRSDDDPETADGIVKGKCRLMPDGSGWEAEFGISWQTLYNDAVEKLGEGKIDFQFDKDHPIKLPMLICYIDHDESGATVGAWGTSAEQGSLAGQDGWYPENAGAILVLNGEDDSAFQIDTEEATTAEETTAEKKEETTAEKKEETTAKTEVTTVAEVTTAGAADETTEAAKKGGCGGVIGGFAVIAVLAFAGVTLKKKN